MTQIFPCLLLLSLTFFGSFTSVNNIKLRDDLLEVDRMGLKKLREDLLEEEMDQLEILLTNMHPTSKK